MVMVENIIFNSKQRDERDRSNYTEWRNDCSEKLKRILASSISICTKTSAVHHHKHSLLVSLPSHWDWFFVVTDLVQLQSVVLLCLVVQQHAHNHHACSEPTQQCHRVPKQQHWQPDQECSFCCIGDTITNNEHNTKNEANNSIENSYKYTKFFTMMVKN